MWPANQPELAEPVVYEGTENAPSACRCYNKAEHEILLGEVPEAIYLELVMEIEEAVRNECDVVVPLGWDHNCYLEQPAEGIEFTKATPSGDGMCVGACYYDGPECPDEPNPYECEEEFSGGETGADETSSTSSTTRVASEELQWQL